MQQLAETAFVCLFYSNKMCAVALLMAACGAVAGPVADPNWGHHHHHHGHGGYGGINNNQ